MTGRDVERGEQVGLGVMAGGAQLRDSLRLRHTGRQPSAEDPGEHQVGGMPEQPRTKHGEPDAHHRQRDRHNEQMPLRAQQPE